jgi:hypothetical protein
MLAGSSFSCAAVDHAWPAQARPCASSAARCRACWQPNRRRHPPRKTTRSSTRISRPRNASPPNCASSWNVTWRSSSSTAATGISISITARTAPEPEPIEIRRQGGQHPHEAERVGPHLEADSQGARREPEGRGGDERERRVFRQPQGNPGEQHRRWRAWVRPPWVARLCQQILESENPSQSSSSEDSSPGPVRASYRPWYAADYPATLCTPLLVCVGGG